MESPNVIIRYPYTPYSVYFRRDWLAQESIHSPSIPVPGVSEPETISDGFPFRSLKKTEAANPTSWWQSPNLSYVNNKEFAVALYLEKPFGGRKSLRNNTTLNQKILCYVFWHPLREFPASLGDPLSCVFGVGVRAERRSSSLSQSPSQSRYNQGSIKRGRATLVSAYSAPILRQLPQRVHHSLHPRAEMCSHVSHCSCTPTLVTCADLNSPERDSM